MNTPRRIDIVVLSGSSLLSVASAADPIRAANRLSGERLFDWRILSADGEPPVLSNGLPFPVGGTLKAEDHGAALVIVAGFAQQYHASPAFLRTLASAGRNYEILCGVEAGTWLFARAGLIRHEQVTTHWEDFELLESTYPDLDVRRDRFVIDGRIWTAGGASPALDMMLHMIRQWHGASLALDAASVFIYDQAHPATDAQPVVSPGQLASREPRLATAIDIMQKTLDTPLPVPAIARRSGLSARMLEMLFARHVGVPPGRYYLALRLQAARKMVLDTALSMQDIAIRTGFASQSALSRSFSRRYGQSPLKMRLAG